MCPVVVVVGGVHTLGGGSLGSVCTPKRRRLPPSLALVKEAGEGQGPAQ